MLIDICDEVKGDYEAIRDLSDGRTIGVRRLLYHWTLHVDIDYAGYADNYCFATRELALAAFLDWDGIGDPVGWHRHPKSGRRRNLETGQEWVAF